MPRRRQPKPRKRLPMAILGKLSEQTKPFPQQVKRATRLIDYKKMTDE